VDGLKWPTLYTTALTPQRMCEKPDPNNNIDSFLQRDQIDTTHAIVSFYLSLNVK